MDAGTWMVGWGQNHNKPVQLFLPHLFVKLAGYSTKVFCFCCVSWQGYICLDKYLSQPLSTDVAYIPNDGNHPASVTFCKRLPYSNMSFDLSHKEEVFEDLLSIEAQYVGSENWNLVYEGFFMKSALLATRKFITYSFSEDMFKFCDSLQLGTETRQLSQLSFKYKQEHGKEVNIQMFIHGWGAFEMVKYELPMKGTFQSIIQLSQETMATVSSSLLACSSYENSSLDLCLHKKAVQYVRDTVGCTTSLIR